MSRHPVLTVEACVVLGVAVGVAAVILAAMFASDTAANL